MGRRWLRHGLPAAVSTLLGIATGLLTNIFTTNNAVLVGLSLAVVVLAWIGWESWRAVRANRWTTPPEPETTPRQTQKQSTVRVTSQLRRTLEGPATSVAYSLDGDRLVTAGAPPIARGVRVWDSASGTLLHHLKGHTDWTSSAAWSPDGRLVATCSEDMSTRIWDAATGRCISVLSAFPALARRGMVLPWTGMATGYRGLLFAVAFAPDGRQLVTGSQDGRVRLWDVDTGKFVRVVGRHAGQVLDVAWSRHGRLATASADGTARIWNMTSKTIDQVLDGHPGAVWSVAWAANGRYVATASDKSAYIWDATTGKRLEALVGHTAAVNGVAWSPSCRYLVTGGDDRTARIWEASSGLCLHTITGHRKVVRGVDWSPDGRHVAAACSNGVQVWAIKRRKTAHSS